MRREKDFLGERDLDENALYGIHSVRARDNFPDQGRFNEEWYRAMAVTKQACYLAAASFFKEAAKEYEALKEQYIKEGNTEEVMYLIGKVTGLWEATNIIAALWKKQ